MTIKLNNNNGEHITIESPEFNPDDYLVLVDNPDICISLKSPCRINFLSEETFDAFMHDIKDITKYFDVSIEYPLDTTRAYRVVFLDKHLIGITNEVQRLQI